MAKTRPSGSCGNRLLDRLPRDDQQSLLANFRKVDLAARQALYEPKVAIEYIYFPLSAVLSAVTVMEDGSMIEVATIGNEGAAGHPASSLVPTASHRAFAQIGGESLRMDVAQFKREIGRRPKLRETMAIYHEVFLFQVSQSVACNGLHVIRQRCCRWLLMTHDRVQGDDVHLTHEFLSIMLGVRRPSVTEVLQSLEADGVIRQHVGKIEVLDRKGMEACACECYRAVTEEYRRLLG